MKPNVIKGIVVAVLLVAAAVLFWWQLQPDAETRAAIQRGREGRPESATQAADQPAPAAGAAAAAPAAAPAGQETQLDLDALLASVQQVEFEYAANRPVRDPMRALVGLTRVPSVDPRASDDPSPVSMVPPAIRSMILSGIIFDEQRPMAVLDNEVVFPGYEFPNGVVVEAIEPTAVRLRMGDREFTLNYEEL